MSTPYWTKAIEEARQRQQQGQVPFTEEQVGKAGSWVTCVCGDSHPELLHTSTRAPKDKMLICLGRCFDCAVFNQRVALAEVLIGEIEHRAAELLAELKQRQENE